MENLKNYRISLKFSEKDSDQRDVAKLLKQLGRKKSSFITKAIKYYLANNPSPEIPGNNNVLTELFTENMVKATIIKMIQSGELQYNLSDSNLKQTSTNQIPSVNVEISEDDYIESKSSSETKFSEKNISEENIQNSKDIDDLLNMLEDI